MVACCPLRTLAVVMPAEWCEDGRMGRPPARPQLLEPVSEYSDLSKRIESVVELRHRVAAASAASGRGWSLSVDQG